MKGFWIALGVTCLGWMLLIGSLWFIMAMWGHRDDIIEFCRWVEPGLAVLMVVSFIAAFARQKACI